MISNHDESLHAWLKQGGYTNDPDITEKEDDDIDFLKCRKCKFGCKAKHGYYACTYDGNPKIVNMKCMTRLIKGRQQNESV